MTSRISGVRDSSTPAFLMRPTGCPSVSSPWSSKSGRDRARARGTLLLLYTDGITEAANPEGDEFGLDRLQAVVREYAQEPLVVIAGWIENAVEVFADGTPYGDDRTIVTLRREP